MVTRTSGGGILVTLLVCGCLGGNPQLAYMRAAPPGANLELAPPGQARVVFVSESRFVGGAFLIIDEKGRFVGESAPGTRFCVLVAPGGHYFISWGSGRTETLHATVSAGRTYWVLVTKRPSLWAVSDETGLVKEIPSYLERTKALVPDAKAGQAYLDSLGDVVEKAVKDGISTYQAYSDEDRADATLLAGDYVSP
jgi:hypothetical protein